FGLVDERERRVQLPRDALRELALAAPHFEYAARVALGDRLERELPCVRSLGIRVDRLARTEIRLVGVLLADECRIVQLRHGSTIGRPGTPRGALPAPSQALTVAPTSANSPSSWIAPAAFLPSTYASRSAYSREWSVEGVVGSQP